MRVKRASAPSTTARRLAVFCAFSMSARKVRQVVASVVARPIVLAQSAWRAIESPNW